MTKTLLILSTLFSFYAKAWDIRSGEYKNETELYIETTEGNYNSENYGLKQTSKYKWNSHAVLIKGSYYLSKSQYAEPFYKWDLKLRFDQDIAQDLGVYGAHTIEANRSAGFIQRNSFDAGLKYLFLNEANDLVIGEGGYRYSFELRIPPQKDVNLHMGRVYLEYTHNFEENVYATLWIEYLREIANPNNYFVNFEPSLTTYVTKYLWLRVSYMSFYTNEPPGQKLLRDAMFSTSLVSKF